MTLAHFAATPARAPAGRQIAIASGKGGVGKTFLAISLAHAFWRRGERVLLFDGDLGLANVDVQLGLQPTADLAAVIAGRVELEDALVTIDGGFDVLAGRSGSGALGALAMEEVAGLAAGLAALSLSYDRVILDLAAGVEPATLRLAVAADDVVVVIQDEPTSLTDAYAFIKRLRQRDDGANPLLVVNAADGPAAVKRAAGTIAKTCEAFLSFTPRLAGAVRRDQEVKRAIRAQTLLAQRAPGSRAAEDIAALAEALAQGS